jgi:hypothetical protein
LQRPEPSLMVGAHGGRSLSPLPFPTRFERAQGCCPSTGDGASQSAAAATPAVPDLGRVAENGSRARASGGGEGDGSSALGAN